MSDTLILCAVFVLSLAAFLIVISIAFATFARNPLKARVTKLSHRKKVVEPSGLKGLYSFLIGVIKRLSPMGTPKEEREISRTQMRLMSAGYRGKGAPRIFYGLKVFLAILFPAMFLVVRAYWISLSHTHSLIVLVLLIAMGIYLPDLWIYWKATKRREKVREGFPDALDLLVVCVEAGQGLDAAINKVGDEIGPHNKTLSEEFKFLTLEVRAGKPRRVALKNLAQRVDIEEISSFVVLVNQTEEFGVSIAKALRIHSDSMRTKRHQRAEEVAAKIPVKLTLPLVLFIMPTLFIVMMGPAIITFIRGILQSGFLG